MQISKCEDKDLERLGLLCKSSEEIDDFIDHIDVTGFSITEKIDFHMFNKKPVHSLIKKHFNKYLDSTH
jgi:hypothetical protein